MKQPVFYFVNRRMGILGITLWLLSFLIGPGLQGQETLKARMVNDSLITRLKIKQVTEDWFIDPHQASPANTTMEIYNEAGERTRRIHINYDYHKFVTDYSYDRAREILVETQYYYDWNPNRESRKGDTILKKSVRKYAVSPKKSKNRKPGAFEAFQPRITRDNAGRITETIDTIKCGYRIMHYAYDDKGRVVERKHYTTQHEEAPGLIAVDSLHYNERGFLVKEEEYHQVKQDSVKWNYDSKTTKTYIYQPNGLLSERINLNEYASGKGNTSEPSVFRYRYEFY